jgi:hypothetical protein
MKTEVNAFKELVGGKIFSVEFIKKDGTIRRMTCRFEVKKYLKGGSLAYDAASLNYLTVFDMEKKEYRTVNLNTLQKLTFEGNTYTI